MTSPTKMYGADPLLPMFVGLFPTRIAYTAVQFLWEEFAPAWVPDAGRSIAEGVLAYGSWRFAGNFDDGYAEGFRLGSIIQGLAVAREFTGMNLDPASRTYITEMRP